MYGLEEFFLKKIIDFLSGITYYYLGFHGDERKLKPIRKIKIKPEMESTPKNEMKTDQSSRNYTEFTEKWIEKIEQISEIESLPDSGVESSFSMINVDQDLIKKTENLNDSYFEDDYINDLIGEENYGVKFDSLHKEAMRIGHDLHKISHRTKDLRRKSLQIDELLRFNE